jgi:hypothetical protein
MLFANYNYSLVITQAMNMVLDITSTVFSTLENIHAAGNFDKTQGDKKKQLGGKELSAFRDNLNMAAYIVDNTIMDIVLAALAGPNTINPSALSLDSFGCLSVSANTYKGMKLEEEDYETPTPAIMTAAESAAAIVSATKDLADLANDVAKLIKNETERKASHGDEYGMVNRPTASPPAGNVTRGTIITLRCSTADARIYYTTDGNKPDAGNAGMLYSSPITVNEAMTIKAIATKDGNKASLMLEASYKLKVCTPTASPPAGKVRSGDRITLDCGTSGATIKYTTNGGDPRTSAAATAGTGPITITITQETTIKAIAVNGDMHESDVLKVKYTV